MRAIACDKVAALTQPPCKNAGRDTGARAGLGGVLALVLVVCGLYSAGLAHDDARALAASIERGTFTADPASLLRAARAYFTDDGDLHRYEAYARAARGQIHQRYYVKDAATWRDEFREQNTEVDEDAVPSVLPPRPLVPYRDYLVEYPPGFFLFALPPALLAPARAGGSDDYRLLFCTQMALLLLGATALCASLARDPDGAAAAPARLWIFSALACLLVGTVATHRYDAAISFLLCATAWAAQRRRFALLGAALGLAVATKGVPILCAPVWAVWVLRERPRALGRATVAALAVGLALALPVLCLAGTAPLAALRYHADRPLQIESTYAALLGLWQIWHPGTLRVALTFGSFNVVPVADGTPAPLYAKLAGPLLLAALGALYVFTAQRLRALGRRSGPETGSGQARLALAQRAALAALVLFMVLGKVCSPQYLVWLLPLGVSLSLRARSPRLVWWLLFSCALTQVIVPGVYHALRELRPWACALVLVRNLALAVWAIKLLRASPVQAQAQAQAQTGRA